MGGGSAVRQYQRRFLQGEPEKTGKKEECKEAYRDIRAFGEYRVRGAEDKKYELVKRGEVIGMFSEAHIKEDRILFPLSRGMLLEVSEGGIREIATSEKAAFMGMIASDGGNALYRKERPSGGYRTEYLTRFHSEDKELIEVFDRLCVKTYNVTPHHYTQKGSSIITAKIFSKGIFYDLDSIGLKPGPYEIHVPRERLDGEGKRAFLKGFFSGDGNISLSKGRIKAIRTYSKHEKGLEELHETFTDLGFHPSDILEYRKDGNVYYCFLIPAGEYAKFIDEIGSYKPKHLLIFEEFKKKKEEKE
ncbi:MAG: LAGLIDADG family homing endonuclease [Candidatus Jordarchaeales archaeon]